MTRVIPSPFLISTLLRAAACSHYRPTLPNTSPALKRSYIHKLTAGALQVARAPLPQRLGEPGNPGKTGPTGILKALAFTDHFPSFVVAVHVLLPLHKHQRTLATDKAVIPITSHSTIPSCIKCAKAWACFCRSLEEQQREGPMLHPWKQTLEAGEEELKLAELHMSQRASSCLPWKRGSGRRGPQRCEYQKENKHGGVEGTQIPSQVSLGIWWQLSQPPQFLGCQYHKTKESPWKHLWCPW